MARKRRMKSKVCFLKRTETDIDVYYLKLKIVGKSFQRRHSKKAKDSKLLLSGKTPKSIKILPEAP